MERIFFEMQMIVGGNPVCLVGRGGVPENKEAKKRELTPPPDPLWGWGEWWRPQLCKLPWPRVTTPTPAPGFLWGGAGEPSGPCELRALRSSPPFTSAEGKENPQSVGHAGFGVTRAKEWEEELGQMWGRVRPCCCGEPAPRSWGWSYSGRN